MIFPTCILCAFKKSKFNERDEELLRKRERAAFLSKGGDEQADALNLRVMRVFSSHFAHRHLAYIFMLNKAVFRRLLKPRKTWSTAQARARAGRKWKFF